MRVVYRDVAVRPAQLRPGDVLMQEGVEVLHPPRVIPGQSTVWIPVQAAVDRNGRRRPLPQGMRGVRRSATALAAVRRPFGMPTSRLSPVEPDRASPPDGGDGGGSG